MDIWFDSGISWSYALDGKKSDLYLEGKDQFGGWFQSSILTSVAAGNGAPFKQIMTHGFVVDKNGKKMSKSIGNVIDPEDILNGKNAFGVDTLRWWVGSHSQQNLIPISNGILKSDSDNVHQIRKILRFLLGALNNTLLEEDSNLPKNLQTIDRYILNTCYKFYHSVISSYNDYNIYNACSKILYFVSNEISSRYIAIIRDRLYCDEKDSPRRTACLYTLNGILKTVSYVIAPILPHLAEEVFLYYPLNKTQRKLFYTENPWSPPYSWKDDSTDEIMQLIYKIKKNNFMEKSSQKLSCSIEIEEKNFLLLKVCFSITILFY